MHFQHLLLLPLSSVSSLSEITSSRNWSEYVALSAELQLVNLSQLSPLEKTCFFLNVYHTMVLHGLVDKEFVQGSDLKDKWLQFARGIKYMVGAFNYSIESIEDLLRQSSLAGGSGGRPAGMTHRAGGAVVMCMSKMIAGSPPVQVYHPSLWDQQLAVACRAVCLGVQVKTSAKTVVLPKVFETHRELFPRECRELFAAISVDCPAGVQRALASASSFKIKFEREDWRVVYPSPSDMQGGGGRGLGEPDLGATIDEQLDHQQIQQQQQQQQQQQYALEYRGDLHFHLPPTPTFAPPLPPSQALTSLGLPALTAPARCVGFGGGCGAGLYSLHLWTIYMETSVIVLFVFHVVAGCLGMRAS